MLTGPVTILCWSFVRDDLEREEVCRQLALALRDEVLDLERAGLKIIQIDEAALREGLPLREDEAEKYLQWAIDAFRLTVSGVEDTTQIHTHMCYSEFNAILKWIAAMDADVISAATWICYRLLWTSNTQAQSALASMISIAPAFPAWKKYWSASNRPYGLSPRKNFG